MSGYAFLFTGQGAQYANMGKDLYEKYDIFKEVFDSAGEHLKINLTDICSDNLELAKTHNAQAAIFTVSYGIFKLLEKNNIKPDCAAGFSLGEITSLAASEILSFTDALDLIKIRGEEMQAACDYKPGLMYSIIGAEDELVEEICAEVSKTLKPNGYVIPANYNCPRQIAISGEADSVEQAVKIFAEKKIRTVKLNVAGAFHSELMRQKPNGLTDFLKTINYSPPKFDLYSNVTGEKFDFGEDIKSFMINYIPEQMSNPVKFRAELENISKTGCELFTEIGAGRVLSGFVKRTCTNAKFINIQDVQTFESVLEMFHVKHIV